MHRHHRLGLSLCLLVAATLSPSRAGEPADTVSPALQGDATRPAQARWLRSELYFGLTLIDTPADYFPNEQTDISDEVWRAFLDKEVTPRFPDGLTVLDAYGQWLEHSRTKPARLRTKILVILHEDTPRRRADIDAIRASWKAATRQASVLLVAQPAEISF